MINKKISELKDQFKDFKKDTKINTKIKKNYDEIGLKKKIKEINRLNRNPKGFKNIMNKPGEILEAKNLSRIYPIGTSGYFNAFKNANFSIKKGSIVVILGPSGSGKSSLLNVISGLDRNTEGDIIIQNVNLGALKNGELTNFRRKNIGFIFQSYNLLPELNAYENVEIGMILQKDPIKRLNIDDIFEQIDLKDQKHKNIRNLSGGQQQRVSIARAIAKNPQLIFADEPTGALDSVTSQKVVDLFQMINKKYKTTIVIVTHDEKISKIADQIIYVKDGKISVNK